MARAVQDAARGMEGKGYRRLLALRPAAFILSFFGAARRF